MAIKKSELYSKIWNACDELRGGMDASEYKNYILVLLFVKYVSDKYAGDQYAPIQVPTGSSYADLSKLKGSKNIGDDINKKIIGPLFAKNRLPDPPDFDDSSKLGNADEKVKRLSNLVAIFEDKNLDFSANRADGDDLLGDAYEYLMRHFATESGKSKGQFYTPAEVSRVIAQIIGIRDAKTSKSTTVYDPTCGSGSLLLKVADAARTPVSIYGQEKDHTTSTLARMNMILHDNPTAEILAENTLAEPQFKDDGKLKRFDYVVANPPFSDKRWSTGVHVNGDPYERFAFGTPPEKQGDYAYLLHILASLKSTGIGICVLPHGVLFRASAEGGIRERLVREGYILGIIGLPGNLFYGTGIPACLIVVDKAGAKDRKGIFMLDASSGYIKDGPKNCLRSRDIHKIVDAFTRKVDIPGYARMVLFSEIEANDFNLNLPRYIDTRDTEDIQDIDGHLNGGIPNSDVDALGSYWKECPSLKQALFVRARDGYVDIAPEQTKIKATIQSNTEFRNWSSNAHRVMDKWCEKIAPTLKKLEPGFHPTSFIYELSESLLALFNGQPLIDPYAVYQVFMDYWDSTMQDDCYIIAADGWKAEPHRVIEKVTTGKNKGKEKDVGWACDLVPKEYIVRRYFAKAQSQIDDLATKLATVKTRLAELIDEHAEEGGALDLDPLNVATVTKRFKEIAENNEFKTEAAALKTWLDLEEQEAETKKAMKSTEKALDEKALAKFQALSQDDVRSLVVEDKWIGALTGNIIAETDRISFQLTVRLRELSRRYSVTLPTLEQEESRACTAATEHLASMGYSERD